MTAPAPVGHSYGPYGSAPDSFRILFVCTGSICRSPIAERLARLGLERRLAADDAVRLSVESAGTWGHEGAPMEPHAAEVLLEYGADPGDFHGRELLDEHVAEADLVLTATLDHRAHVVSMGHASGLRTFTLKEFTRLVAVLERAPYPERDLVQRGRSLVRAAAALRGRLAAPDPEWDEVADPYGAPLSVFRATASDIGSALDPVLTALTGHPAHTP
ncbi:low molecular weight phosphatase family protein [Embleya sp. NBC_00896]|uniref:arsenate reductase/protein-tyrosine-phosphatase family protein n=1 Tax=Embleya sp. NBC_00896 TaxID=2975961 RepID=UPI00386A0393|nr:low molecular weight phosphatase family protein [Embleya sp. NBC_00896]